MTGGTDISEIISKWTDEWQVHYPAAFFLCTCPRPQRATPARRGWCIRAALELTPPPPSSGIPISKLVASEREKLLHLPEELHKRVIGQVRGTQVPRYRRSWH